MSGEDAGGANSIQLDDMSLDQLQQLRQQEESRLQGLTQRYAQLRAAAARISASSRAVDELEKAPDDAQVLVPLTESLYVPGKVKPRNKLLVELGTGYFVEKSTTDTQAFLDRKARLVQENTDNVTHVIQVTQNNIQSVVSAMQGKLLEIRAKQEGARHRAAVEGQS
mmetsp:Transcript_7592/g.9930  ORF Transcript_7592/g.9930 Transcript_7592/m.9930 type:complete len:167 (-) Transcript_7592:50-550(-)|eukprot:CAMPEP_0198143476 /NCGR_PEP_ID=MMETSP1443-20131203/7825_1 /TAXON_ID=186043 /ORGANISM="Entomoneis sp., Strain CCMP2396" /LENGTH=166 /DNA_ID=CAMNT_0043806721 /DNA_START=151 /DNA_END=651 /DNA_ORIENTATION=+